MAMAFGVRSLLSARLVVVASARLVAAHRRQGSGAGELVDAGGGACAAASAAGGARAGLPQGQGRAAVPQGVLPGACRRCNSARTRARARWLPSHSCRNNLSRRARACQAAASAYSQALELEPRGPHREALLANRAACYLQTGQVRTQGAAVLARPNITSI
eukprot:scaffold7_cov378-Prasinococcus_capsulatus_cf.AAC.23